MIPINKVQGSADRYLEKLYPPSIVMKACGIFLMCKVDEVGKHVNPTNISGPQEPEREIIYVLGKI